MNYIFYLFGILLIGIVGEIASYSIDKYIYPNNKELKKSAGAISAKNYPEYFESWKDDRWSYYYSKYIHSKVNIVKLLNYINYSIINNF